MMAWRQESEFGKETLPEKYLQFVLLLTPTFTFFHDGVLAEGE
jgi:hypothetical protein